MDILDKFSSLQELSKLQLSKIFDINPGKKFLIIESNLIKPLEGVCGVRWLKENGVEKIFKLEPVAPNCEIGSVFYMIEADRKVFKQVVDQIRSQIDILNPPANKYHIIVIPRYLCALEKTLEQFGLYGVVALHSFSWMPLHLDEGILSLELPQIFSSLFVDQSVNFLPVLSKTLWQLSFIIGKPQFIFSLGQYSNALLKQYEQFCDDIGDPDKTDCDIGALVIIDRNLDYPSALLTPGTYTGLLKEVYPVRAGICESKDANSGKLDSRCNVIVEKPQVNFSLDSRQDTIYLDIKNQYFTEVTSILRDLTRQLKSEKMSSKDMALDQIKQYVRTKLQQTQSRKRFITNHLLAAEGIIGFLGHRYENLKAVEDNIMGNTEKAANFNFLEELLATENDKYITLRLFCLLAITQTCTENEVNSFFTKYSMLFGYNHAYFNLIKAGILAEPLQIGSLNLQEKLKIPRLSSSNFYVIAKALKQFPLDSDKINLKQPTCPSYVFRGTYIPMIAQLISMLSNSLPLEDIRSKLESLGNLEIRNNRGYPLHTRSVLVYFVGGITYAEIAACNLLETLTGTKIYFITDRIVNGNELMDGMLTTCPKCPIRTKS